MSMSDLEIDMMAALIRGTKHVGTMVPVEELARFRELEAENARLAAFAREIITFAFDGADADGGSIQRLAVHYGLLRETKYDPKEHGPSFADPGDEWFVYTDTIARHSRDA